MRKLIAILIVLFFTQIILGQEIVIAENGLNVRLEPNSKSKKIGKLHCGVKIKVTERTGKLLSLKDNGEIINGEWVKIDLENFPMFVPEFKAGYVFNGYLKSEKEFSLDLEKHILKYEKFKDYQIAKSSNPFFITGDFFGDGTVDFAIKVFKEKGNVVIIIMDIGGDKSQFLKPIENYNSDDNSNREIEEFGWADIFEKVNSGTILWSNYTDDFRSLEEVPSSEKVVLNYDAIYVHASESCGGGFIYWKDEVFNWLQQE